MSDTDQASAAGEEVPVQDEVPDQKAAFKAALDRKNAASLTRSQHLDGDNHIAGNSHAAASKRMFRRKSGG